MCWSFAEGGSRYRHLQPREARPPEAFRRLCLRAETVDHFVQRDMTEHGSGTGRKLSRFQRCGEFHCRLGLDAARPVLALLPGSRVGEIERLGPDFLSTASRLLAQDPALQVVVPMANEHARAAFQRVLAAHSDSLSLSASLQGSCEGCRLRPSELFEAGVSTEVATSLTERRGR